LEIFGYRIEYKYPLIYILPKSIYEPMSGNFLQKNVWHDAKTVNVIRSACYTQKDQKFEVTKLTAMALRFFLGSDEDEDEGKDDEDNDAPNIKDVKMANKVNKTSRKRIKMLANVKKAHKKKLRSKKVESFNFSALHLIHDPQKFAEDLYKCWRDSKEKFEINLLFADLISRLIGTHQLFVLNYYKKIADYLKPHQREVIPMLKFATQVIKNLKEVIILILKKYFSKNKFI
jgi:protein SDA1